MKRGGIGGSGHRMVIATSSVVIIRPKRVAFVNGSRVPLLEKRDAVLSMGWSRIRFLHDGGGDAHGRIRAVPKCEWNGGDSIRRDANKRKLVWSAACRCTFHRGLQPVGRVATCRANTTDNATTAIDGQRPARSSADSTARGDSTTRVQSSVDRGTTAISRTSRQAADEERIADRQAQSARGEAQSGA